MNTVVIKKYEIQGTDGRWLTVTETRERQDCVLAIHDHHDQEMISLTLNREQFEALCDLRYEHLFASAAEPLSVQEEQEGNHAA